jgi:hypothetical protein
MSLDVIEITNAWIDSVFADDEQKSIANKRNQICQSCPSLKLHFAKWKKISIQKCNECGCPISKKIFSRKFNACPLSKWENVDNEHQSFFQNQFKKKSKI